MPAPRIDIAVLDQIFIGWGLITGRMMSVLVWGQTMSRFFRRVLLECAVSSFAVRVATWVEIYEIVFANSATEVLSYCVAVAIFARARVWSCCISVNSSTLDCADCKSAAYLLVFEVLDDLWVSLNALAKRALKLLQVFSSLGFWDHSQQ